MRRARPRRNRSTGFRVFASVDELLRADLKLDAACVAVPTVKHHEVAAALLDAGLDLLVEKPLAANLAEAGDLIERAELGKAESSSRGTWSGSTRRCWPWNPG